MKFTCKNEKCEMHQICKQLLYVIGYLYAFQLLTKFHQQFNKFQNKVKEQK